MPGDNSSSRSPPGYSVSRPTSKTLHEELTQHEQDWRDRYTLLQSHGYSLRARYEPNHVWSWNIPGNENLNPSQFIDEWGRTPLNRHVVDATRITDNTLVCIKKVKNPSTELSIAQTLEELPSEPTNHCLPILSIITQIDPQEEGNSSRKDQSGSGQDSIGQFADEAWIIMPFLRPVNDPRWETVNDIVDFVSQILEGLVFLHKNNIAHRDCARKNLMMDGSSLFPNGFHPMYHDRDRSGKGPAERRSRSSGAVKYYFVDFGISTKVEPGESPLVLGRAGLDQEVPELSDEVPYDAFKVDVFIIGNTFKSMICDQYSNTSFLLPLIHNMTRHDPSIRCTAIEAERQWNDIKRNLSFFTVSQRLRSCDERWLETVVRDSWNIGRRFFGWFMDFQG